MMMRYNLKKNLKYITLFNGIIISNIKNIT